MSHAPHTIQKYQEINVFGLTIEDGENRYYLQIGHDEAKARSTSFSELYEAFQKVEPADMKEWLMRNGAVAVPTDPITQTIVVDAKAARMQATNDASANSSSN